MMQCLLAAHTTLYPFDYCDLPGQVIPIIEIPGFGTTSAVKVCEDMKITSQVSHAEAVPGGLPGGQTPCECFACSLVFTASAALGTCHAMFQLYV